MFAYKNDWEVEYGSTIEYLKERYPLSFTLIYDLFGYEGEIARLFILRFNQELIYEFGGLTFEQAKIKIKNYLQ
jgi:hypothetical protein